MKTPDKLLQYQSRFMFCLMIFILSMISLSANAQGKEKITIKCDQGLETLMNQWSNEFLLQNSALSFQVIPETINDESSADLHFMTEEGGLNETSASWQVKVGKDVLVILTSIDNPVKGLISNVGIKNSLLFEMMQDPTKRNWIEVDNSMKNSLAFYGAGSNRLRQSLSRRAKAEDLLVLNGWDVSVNAMVNRLLRDNSALGICSMGELLSQNEGKLPAGIMIVPIDKNNNSRLDAFERVFDSPEELIRGAWAGKYPSHLCPDLVLTSARRPESKQLQTFISWIIWEGQQGLNKNGYCALTQQEKEANTRLISGVTITTAALDKPVGMELWLIILLVLTGVGFVAGLIIFAGRNSRNTSKDAAKNREQKLDAGKLTCPKGYYFDKSHTWCYMEEEGNVKVGVDDFLQHITGSLSRVSMLGTGSRVRKGERLLTLINNGKQLNIYSPVTGIIVENNVMVDGDSSLLNNAPYHEGWIYRIEPANWKRELDFLMAGTAYSEWIRKEMSRLRDFFSMSVPIQETGMQAIIIQDGGEITDHVLAELGPEVWEDFQCHFIDPSR